MLIKEAIEQGLFTKKELTEIGTQAKRKAINDKILRQAVTDLTDFIREHKTNREIGYWGTTSLTLNYAPWDKADKKLALDCLKEIRALLRDYFGEWKDEVYYQTVGEDNIEVTYQLKDDCEIEMPFCVSIEINYPLDDIPAGIIKEGCQIVEETQVYRRVECNL